MKTGTQNRPYPTGELKVKAVFSYPTERDAREAYVAIAKAIRGVQDMSVCELGYTGLLFIFNWNNRDHVRVFAPESDRCLRLGGMTSLAPEDTSKAISAVRAEPIPKADAVGVGNG